MKKIILLLAAFIFILSACAVDTSSPTNSESVGRLIGFIKNNLGKPIAGAEITTEPAFKKVISDERGFFEFVRIPEGDYFVTASKIGYNKQTVEAKVAAAYKTSVMIILKAGNDDNRPPNKPLSPIPEHESSISTTEFTLRWECSDPDGDPLKYDVFLGIADRMEKIADNISEPFVHIADLHEDVIYFWKVIAKDGKGGISVSDVWSFHVIRGNLPPLPPISPNPPNNAVINKPAQLFTWECQDPDGDKLVYNVYLGKNDGIMYRVASGIPTKLFIFSQLSDNSNYSWQIEAIDERGAKTKGEIWHFTTKFGNTDWQYKLIAYYPFDGNGYDAGPNRYNAHNFGAVPSEDRKNNSEGSMYFGGRGQYMTLPNPRAFALQGDFTIAYWVKPNLKLCKPDITHINIISKSDFNGNWWTSGITKILGIEFWVNGEYIGYDKVKIKDLKWSHISVVFKQNSNSRYGTATLFLNGSQFGKTKPIPMPSNLTSDVWIGQRADQESRFAGWLDDLYFYDRALTELEIKQLAR